MPSYGVFRTLVFGLRGGGSELASAGGGAESGLGLSFLEKGRKTQSGAYFAEQTGEQQPKERVPEEPTSATQERRIVQTASRRRHPRQGPFSGSESHGRTGQRSAEAGTRAEAADPAKTAAVVAGWKQPEATLKWGLTLEEQISSMT